VTDDGELTGVVGCCEQQQLLHRLRQHATAVEECLLHAGGQVQLLRQWRGPTELSGAEFGRKFQQRQRVPTALCDKPVGDLLRRRAS
jgi:hypothetical protein